MASRGKPENLTKKGQFKYNRELARKAGEKGRETQRRKRLITEYIIKLLEKKIEIKKGRKKETRTGAEHLVAVLYDKALKGDMQAIKEIIDRVEGKPLQKTEAEIVGNNVKIEITGVDADKKD